jgi:phosphonate metabolism-associated iron-containing alcohol dehydrogenase
MEIWSYHIPTEVIFGKGCLEKITDIVESFKPNRIMLVTGRKSMKKLGITDRIVDYLKNYQVVTYNKVKQNPGVSTVENGIRFLKDEKCDLVIGLGGGSAIDTAKAISVLSKNQGPVDEYLSGNRKIVNRGVPIVAIPTTAGTGTEVTQYASIIDERKKRKLSLSHEHIHPSVAIVDPILTVTMPKFVTAATGLDALSQCIEAYWSKNHTPISDIFALNGIDLIFKNLVNAFNFPENLEFREKMSLASLFSGITISIAKTTIVHSVSYPLTVHFNVPHGLACALTLPSFIRYNSKTVKDRIYNIARTIGAETVEECIRKVEELISSLEVPRRLSDVGIQRKDIEVIVREGFRPDRAENNPRKATNEDLRAILKGLL